MIKLIIAGDFVPQERVSSQIEAGDYSCLDSIKSITNGADYSIVNFESPVVSLEAKPIVKTGPCLRCTDEAVECIAKAGFNCITLANNHFRDYGQTGVENTIAACLKYGVDYVGGGKDLQNAERTLVKEIRGIRLAIVNVCENEWSIAGAAYGGSNPLNPIRNFQAIKAAKRYADFVVVIVHGGVEMYQYPTPRMVDTYRFFVDAGADVVVNHHQHCYSGYEVYNGKPIFYGLGNFCFDRKNHRNDIWNEGYMVSLQLEDSTICYDLIPYIQCSDVANVQLMTAEKRDAFDKKIAQINEVIASSDSLHQMFDDLLDKVGKERLLNMEPFPNRYVRSLQRRGMFPKLIKGKVLNGWLSRLRCESHLEILVALLTRRMIDEENRQ